MAARALDHYMHNLERGYGCGYLKIGKDPAWESVPEKRPPWQKQTHPISIISFLQDDRQGAAAPSFR